MLGHRSVNLLPLKRAALSAEDAFYSRLTHGVASASGTAVLIISPQPFFLNRGTPINVRALVTSLAAAGYEMDLLVYPYGEQVQIPGVRIYRSWGLPGVKEVPIGPSVRKIFLDFFLLFSALRLCCTRRYRVFHGIEEGAFIAGFLAMIWAKPFVFDMDSCMQQQLRARSSAIGMFAAKLFAQLEKFFLQRASVVLTVCTALTEKVVEVGQALGREIPVRQIEDFPVESAGVADAEEVRLLRESLGIKQGEKVFVYTGNFEAYQGIDLLLQSFARAFSPAATTAKARLLLVGGGGPGVPVFEFYRQRAEALGLRQGQEVIFLGNRPGAEMGLFMALADVLLSPRIEGSNTPLKLYSYMAAQRPVVATKIYSHTQVLDVATAYLAEPNVDNFSRALLQVYGDLQMEQCLQMKQGATSESEAWRKAQRAKILVEQRYSQESFSQRVVEMYSAILAQ